ncbi:MAG: hypothetical protein IPG00_09735 [Saprospiraceae bacterium]|nr:hypothetical protein [Saprospiraceae bacterium]
MKVFEPSVDMKRIEKTFYFLSSISKISVKLNLQGQVYDVGSLVLDDTKRIYFKYNGDFLGKGLNISPIVLDFNDKISTPSTHILTHYMVFFC